MAAPASGTYKALIGQPRVREFLASAVEQDRVSHAYLFLGPAGSGKTEAAWGFAASILCDKGGCGACDTCIRVAHRSHPDVHYIRPEGISSYMIGQVRQINHDAELAPIRGSVKIYILDRVDLLWGPAANAILKTLEEPPEDVVFILLGRSRETIMETIMSRCEVVPFRHVPTSEAVSYLVQITGCEKERALEALSVTGGSLTKARAFLSSGARIEVRRKVLAVLDRLPEADDLDVLDGAKSLLAAAKVPLSDVRIAQEDELKDGADYFSKTALKQIADQQKRDLAAQERDGVLELIAITRSWLRDCLMASSGALELFVNNDDVASIKRISGPLGPEDIAAAVAATDTATRRISYNVSPQLAIEAMLFEIRKVLSCQR